MTLRRLILTKTGQDVQKCRGCQLCNTDSIGNMDIPLDSLIQLVILNDEEVLTSRTLWSDEVLHSAHDACARELDLEKILLVLREEAVKRGLVKPESTP
jgi:heterodisulfide reductase subunit C